MHAPYRDIIERIAEPPLWWDENAVPRWVPFSPQELAFIYARETALGDIRCQGCGERFYVSFSEMNALNAYRRNEETWKSRPTLAALITTEELEYGDPPNVRCCSAGPTMSSILVEIVEYWAYEGRWRKGEEEGVGPPFPIGSYSVGLRKWTRKPELERKFTIEGLDDVLYKGGSIGWFLE